MFSKACEYGIRAVTYISAFSSKDHKIGISEIISNIEAPTHFSAKILQQLVHGGILSSQKGVYGGFYTTKSQKTKKLIEVITLLDGDKIFISCGLGLKYCSEKEPCPLHDKFKSVRNDLQEMLEQTSIEELAISLKEGNKFLRTKNTTK